MLRAPSVVGSDLLEALHGFLALEAPFLLTRLPEDLPAAELEELLLARLRDRAVVPDRFAGRELWPGLTQREAAERERRAAEEQIRGFFRRRELLASITPEERAEMHERMLLTRALDGALKEAFDRKTVAWRSYPSPQKGFRSTGQEAVVGTALRLRRPPAWEAGAGSDYRGDVIAPLIRDLGALLMFLPDPLHVLLVQAGKVGTPVGGRDLHLGDLRHGVLPPAAPLAIAAQTVVGLAWASYVRGEDRVFVTYVGDGGASLGEWHEAANFAAARRLPVVFVIENNGWALGTHVSEQSAVRRFALKGPGYGMPGISVFGNDPDEVAAASAWAAERARGGGGPTLLELVTYRRPGHAHHDDDRFHGNPEVGVAGYEMSEERERWEAADPLDLYETRLRELGLLDDGESVRRRERAEAAVSEALAAVDQAPWPEPGDYRSRVYVARREPVPEVPAETRTRRMAYDEAVRQAMTELLEEDERVFVLGEDVGGRYGGAFGVTRGLAKQFGDLRCVNMPLAESAIVGCAVGAALAGMRPIVEMQFADFLASGFNALVNNAAKLHWRWADEVPLVVRLPYGGATGDHVRLLGGGPFHSQCPEMWFLRTPGWKIVAPASPADAKGLLIAAVRDPNPVLFLEAKGLYGFFRTDLREEVPLGSAHEVPIGKAAVRREGEDLTIVTYGAMVWTALAAAEELAGRGVAAEVIDLRSLWPLDRETIEASVRKTGRVLTLHEDTRRGGFAGELAAILADELFWHLDAPLRRVTAPDTPVPYSPPLEHDFLPKKEDVVTEALRLLRE